jgi:hypothetical protein
MADKFTDVITYVLSVALAAGVIAFAAYKVVALNGMENPPPNMGLNFPAPRRKVIMDGMPAADPLTTQSLSAASDVVPARAPQGGLQAFELLTVVDGVAFVAVASDAGKTLVPVTVGSRLPGGLTVSAIRRQDGRWWLVAGTLRLGQSPLPAQ